MPATTEEVMNAIPKGVIFPWTNKDAKIPKGWALCDGKDGRPNLDGIFLQGNPNAAQIGATGGSASANIPSLRVGKSGVNDGNGFNGDGDCQIGVTAATSIGIMPPYYTVQYIIKI